MRWKGRRQSSNIEDRRSASIGRMGRGGGGLLRLLPAAVHFLGVKGTIAAVLAFLAFNYLSGGGFFNTTVPSTQSVAPSELRQSPQEQELAEFVSVVLADTEDTWTALFQAGGASYEQPRLVLYRDSITSACGFGQAAMGPFYCPNDQKIYLDLSFFDEMARRLGAPGDFAQAYVIAHEVGHHVQTLLGISAEVQKARRGLHGTDVNQVSVRQELQADCFAGIWGHYAARSRHLLEEGDIEEGLNAASAIGDDRLQKQTRGHVSPDSFTHGSSAQRVRWFRKGLEEGSLSACDTFAADTL